MLQAVDADELLCITQMGVPLLRNPKSGNRMCIAHLHEVTCWPMMHGMVRKDLLRNKKIHLLPKLLNWKEVETVVTVVYYTEYTILNNACECALWVRSFPEEATAAGGHSSNMYTLSLFDQPPPPCIYIPISPVWEQFCHVTGQQTVRVRYFVVVALKQQSGNVCITAYNDDVVLKWQYLL